MFGQAGQPARDNAQDHFVLSTIVLAMGNLGSDCNLPHLERALRHRSQNVVFAARRSLGEVKSLKSEAALLQNFHEASTVDTRARVQVLRALQKHNCSRETAISVLSEGLRLINNPESRSN